MEALEFPADAAETDPLNFESQTEHKVEEIRRTQRQEFARYVTKEPVPDRSRETPAQSLKEILKNRPDYNGLEPEAVLQAVEKAVELDVPLESKFERRHEAKDRDIPDYTLGIPAETPATSKSVYQRFIAPVLGPQSKGPYAQPAGPKAAGKPRWRDKSWHPTHWRLPVFGYRQAVIGGMAAALVCLLVILVVLLLK